MNYNEKYEFDYLGNDINWNKSITKDLSINDLETTDNKRIKIGLNYKDGHAQQSRKGLKKSCQDNKWKKLLYEYALDTSFHGPKLIVQPQPFTFRRVLWLLLFLTGSAIFLMQTVTSIERYRSFPTSVNVKINYNTSIIFPAVTICNSNAFRSTKAYEYGYYSIINEVYGNSRSTNLSKFGTTPNLYHLYSVTGHSKTDLISKCIWYNTPCSVKDFKTTMTDFGKCYTFNSGDRSALRKAYQTGTKGGLNLQLNIEQYEYMVGPNGGAGIKVLIHNPQDIPMVREHGLAVPPGSHGLIGIKTLEIKNLPPYYGICNDSVKLQYFRDYTIPNCYSNCHQMYLQETCHCRDIFMPEAKGTPPVCNIDLYNTCMEAAQDEYNLKIKEKCHKECPIRCKSILYEPRISYGTVSNFDIEGLTRDNSTITLSYKYIAAREVTQRVNKATVAEDISLISNLVLIVKELDTIFKEMQSNLIRTKISLNNSYTNLQERVNFHLNNCLIGVKFIVEHDFIRGWEVFSERAFHYVTSDFMDYPMLIKTAIENSNTSISLQSRNTRQLVLSPFQTLFVSRKALLERAEVFLNDSNDAYTSGEPLLKFRYTYERRYDMSYISLPLLHVGSSEQNESYTSLLYGFELMKNGVDTLLAVGEKFVQTGEFDDLDFLHGEEKFLAGGRRINYRLFLFESRVVLKPLEVINQRIAAFERLNRTLLTSKTNVDWKIEQIEDQFIILRKQWSNILNIINMSQIYLNDVKALKMPLATKVTSKELSESVHLLTHFFQNIKSLSRELQDNMKILSDSYKEIWTSMLVEESTKGFYEKLYEDCQSFLNQSNHNSSAYLPIFASLLKITNISEIQEIVPVELVQKMNGDFHSINATKYLHELELQFLNWSRALDLSADLDELDGSFLTSFDKFRKSLVTFLDGNKIGNNFFKQNFMSLDVFMHELSYEEISQQKAYEITQMFSEIGGSMGLFIGGSVLSIFEFLDVFIHNGMRIALNR